MSLKKILLAVLIVVVVAGVVIASVVYSSHNVTPVATGKAVKQDLISTVSGTGQIKPLTYVNVGATAFGRITHLYVKEGDHVKKGQLIATVESQQPESQVNAQQATIAADKTTVDSYIAAEKTAAAAVQEAQADLEQKRYDIQRYTQLYKDQLVAKQDYDAKKAAYDIDVATLAQRQAALAQARAQTAAARSQVAQAQATLSGNNYQLGLTESRAPFDALVTNVPVREGETVVVGIQNAEGSTLMTLANMSVITAEVKVDETDIVNIKMGQPAAVTVDAFPGRVLHGHVTEVGDQALLRTTGLATSQSTTGTEEAKDFKVVVTLDNPPDDLRPGLSCNAKITTANKPNVLTIPIQALVERDLPTEETLYKNHGKESDNTAAAATRTVDTQGVYLLVHDGSHLRVRFVPVTTGVIGSTDIEVLSGLKPGDEIVTGRYKVLRTLKSGTAVKRDNSAVTIATDDSSS
ncbi:MAG TPA: efflux RND transporter periplasmic adaptor subunit [Candidatus Aquilonibacter sp.]|nr:efflux RND transporter periplasmic adaptor subunit [Candidatus Aquilonibacter sp.]